MEEEIPFVVTKSLFEVGIRVLVSIRTPLNYTTICMLEI